MGQKVKIVAPRLRTLLEASVENVVSTGGVRCPRCDSWIAHWEILSGCKRGACAKKGCPNPATDGAHVYVDGNLSSIYIVPLCHACNIGQSREFEIRDDVAPVSVSHPEEE